VNSKSDTKSSDMPSIWSRTFVLLCIVNLFQVTGQMMMTTVIPLYARDMGAASSIVGIVVGSFAVTAILTRPVTSPAFDSFPKKPILFGALALVVVCTFLYGAADSVALLTAVRMLHGLAMGCTGPLALALASEVIPQQRMGSGLGIFSLAQALSQSIGPALGLWLIGAVGFQLTFRVAGISMAIALVLILFVKEPPHLEARPPYKVAFNRCFAAGSVPSAVLICIFSAINSSIMAFVAIYAGELGVEGIGMYFTVHALCLIVTRPVFGRAADRFGFAKVIVPSLVVNAAAYILIANATTLPMFIVAGVLTAIGYGSATTLLQTLAMAGAPRSRSGAASSTTFTGLDFAQLVGPGVAGAIAEHFYESSGSEVCGFSEMYLVMFGVALAGILVFLVMYKRIERNMNEARTENSRALAASKNQNYEE
jgi:MFS family permease